MSKSEENINKNLNIKNETKENINKNLNIKNETEENINKYLNESFIDYHVACHPHRLVSEYEKLRKIRKPIIECNWTNLIVFQKKSIFVFCNIFQSLWKTYCCVWYKKIIFFSLSF